jgi:signal transduction histidine kinase
MLHFSIFSMNISLTTDGVNNLYTGVPMGGQITALPRPPFTQGESGTFICTLVHEIRNPLTNINLAIEALTDTKDVNGQASLLKILKRSSDRISDLVTDLLTAQHTNKASTKAHSIKFLLDEVLSLNRDRFMLKNVTVRKTHSMHDSIMQLNNYKVKIALTNIIINAIEAMPATNALLEIATKLLHGVYFIVIKDNGKGISQENLHHIFKPFFTTKQGGMGLGLSGSLSILRANHIGVDVRSEAGKGTSFILFHKNDQL